MTASKVKHLWQNQGLTEIVSFYGHNERKHGKFAALSNFFDQTNWPGPFIFRVPQCLCAFHIEQHEREVTCQFSEKAIMLCRAAAMGTRSRPKGRCL